METERFQEGHPLYARDGGSLSFGVKPAPHAGGRFVVGLSRREGAQFGPWRWVELGLDPQGMGAMAHLRPGSYRVARTWSLPVQGVRVRGPVVEVEVAAGKTASAPDLAIGGGQ
jgi:hypothetical protein